MSALNRLIDLLRPEPTSSPVYRDLLIGAGAGIAGTLLMGQYWVRVAPLLTPKPDSEGSDEGSGDDQKKDDQKKKAPPADQNVISPLGQTHENGESSTAALGRHLYTAVTGRVPEPGTRQALSEAVHWATGIGGGAVCSALLGQWKGQSRGGGLGPVTGLACGAAMWLLLDETLTPLLGLQDGPRSGDLSAHGNRLGAHLFFGLGLGLGAAALREVLPE